ncbi:hypothetical protein ONV78_16775 [Hahella sp. CR1]|uniref:hypothetical protein n=1 Tax=Hahella sp. CR1 TaxID=2992807 RepID=UPI0024434463|nr:hypothetical protein [Hahella sp. CR1]MDG9669395.1 hypothetical protein [Hahella sp. CR1]
MDYKSLLINMGFPLLASEIAAGDIALPFFVEQNPELYGFLPGLIPLWRDNGRMVGYWKHWFCRRSTTIVIERPQVEYLHSEIARSLDQLLYLACFDDIVSEDGVSDELRHIASAISIQGLDELNELYEDYGDDKACLMRLDVFKRNPPFHLDSSGYKGDFPNKNMIFSKELLTKTCLTEFDENLKPQVSTLEESPYWLKTDDQEPLFYQLLEDSNFAGAWMSLNSNGWRFSDAKKAMLKLAEKANNPTFSLLANFWSSLPHEQYGSY